MSQLRFDGKVAIVTGAGLGLGREYALDLASRGCKVLCNDTGGNAKGEGSDPKVVAAVVEEIKKKGGVAVANTDSVDEGDKIVKACVAAFGTVDIIINNAGIIRDISMTKMKDIDWDMIMKTHLKGTYSVTRAAWPILREKAYGRIVCTGSVAGLYGSFGQANYATAKMGMHGFAQTLAREGESKNITVNTICPLAGTRMTQGVMPKPIWEELKPHYIAALVTYLVHDSCEESGSLFEVGAGYVGKLRWERTQGQLFDLSTMTPEAVAKSWEKITDFTDPVYPTSTQDTLAILVGQINKAKEAAPKAAAMPVAEGPAELKATQIFALMGAYLELGEGKDMVKGVQATYNFEIVKKKGQKKPEAVWFIDLKNGNGKVKLGAEKQVDATFTMTDPEFEKVCWGDLNPQMAFMEGKMKIKGNMAKATKFTPELFPQPTQENIDKYMAMKSKL